jgi:hypothetical protein
MTSPSTLEYQLPQTDAGSRPARLGRNVLLYVWLPAALLGTAIGVYACANYNRFAGTDLTLVEIAGIALSMNTGPFVGPLHGRDPFNDFYRMLIPAGLGGLALAWLLTPLVLRRHRGRRLGPLGQAAFLLLHAAAAAWWYLCAIASLGYHLS